MTDGSIRHLPPGDDPSFIVQQQDAVTHQQIYMLGKVAIDMDAHDRVHATQLVATLQECSWLNEAGTIVLRHFFKENLKSYHPWRHAEQHEKWTMALDHDEMQGCVAHCSMRGHNPHLKTIPTYVFSSEVDYQSVQSLLKGVVFLRDYETTSITCRASDSQASRNLCVKSWQLSPDTSKRSLTIPITLSTKAGYRLEHVDIEAQWMRWEKQGSKGVKLEFMQVSRKKSSADVSSAPSRRSTFGLSRIGSSSRTNSSIINSTQTTLTPDQLASPKIAQRWQYITLEFRDKQGTLQSSLSGCKLY